MTLKNVERDPHKRYKVEFAKHLLAHKTSQRKTAELTGLSRETINAIAFKYQEDIGTAQEQAAYECLETARLTGDYLQEQIRKYMNGEVLDKDGNPKELPVGTLSLINCQQLDKFQLLSGEATSRTETTSKDTYKDVDDVFAKLNKMKKAQDASDSPIDV